MLDRDDVRVVEAWEGYMDGESGYHRIWHSRDQPERPKYIPAFFSKPAPAGWTMTGAMLRAFALHLETRNYDDDNYHAGHDYRPDWRQLAAVHFTAWDAYDSDSDDGEQRYRCERMRAAGEGLRDASWATVSDQINASPRNSVQTTVKYMQMIDMNNRFRNRDARFERAQQWGKVVKFLAFDWEGEEIRVAVLESYRTHPWYNGVVEGPRGVLGHDGGANGGLQVVDLSSLDAVLGRIPRIKYRIQGRKMIVVSSKDVVFDPSMGRLRG